MSLDTRVKYINEGDCTQVSQLNVYEQIRFELNEEQICKWNELLKLDFLLEKEDFDIKNTDWLIDLWDIKEDDNISIRVDMYSNVFYESYDGQVSTFYRICNSDIIRYVFKLIGKS